MTHMLPFHPVTELFPPMEAAAFTALVDDIDRHGQKEPILIRDGQVLDGRHRMQACERLGIEPWVREIRPEDGDPLALVISLNLHRRHLTESQRAMVAGRLANLPNGIRADRSSANLQSVPPITQPHAAEQLNVSSRSVTSARQVLEAGDLELVAAVDRGEVAVSTAAILSRLPAEEQREALTRTPEEIRSIARDVKQRIQDAGVAGPSAVRIFDTVAVENALTATEQIAVVETFKSETPPLPTPTEARRIAQEGEPGLMVLANDGRYHTAPGDPEENARMERWLRLREGLESLATVPFPPGEAVASIPLYQQRNVTEWLARAVPFLHQLNQLWSQQYA